MSAIPPGWTPPGAALSPATFQTIPSLQALISTLQGNGTNLTQVLHNLVTAFQTVFPQASAAVVAAPASAPGAVAGLQISVNGTSYVVALYGSP